MGYLGNHLATVVTGVFAVILTGLWPYFVDFAPILNFVFLMAVPIMWFLVFTCWISQKSADHMKKWEASHSHAEKKSLSSSQTTQVYATTPAEPQVSYSEIKEAQNQLTSELNQLKESVKIKDEEIERLNQEISNLQTLVQIESLKTELANLKMLASGKKKTK